MFFLYHYVSYVLQNLHGGHIQGNSISFVFSSEWWSCVHAVIMSRFWLLCMIVWVMDVLWVFESSLWEVMDPHRKSRLRWDMSATLIYDSLHGSYHRTCCFECFFFVFAFMYHVYSRKIRCGWMKSGSNLLFDQHISFFHYQFYCYLSYTFIIYLHTVMY